VLVQSLAEVQLVRRLPPAVFWPRPKVDSAIVLVRPDPARYEHVRDVAGDPQRLRNFLRDLYAHRRKNLRGGLVALPGGRFSKSEVDAKLAGLNLQGTTRAEALDREEHLRLCAVFG
jgi:16S rRNA (adenine1518-N6/adenine1519-N6)-dimethyltransferase